MPVCDVGLQSSVLTIMMKTHPFSLFNLEDLTFTAHSIIGIFSKAVV